MTTLTAVLQIIGRIDPSAWDWIVPEDPTRRDTYAPLHRASEVAFDPQPTPPGIALGTALGREVVRVALQAELGGTAPSKVLEAIVDEWCGTGWPRRFPFPGPKPRPEPDPYEIANRQIAGAIVLANAAAGLQPGEMQDTLSAAADRLAETAATVG